MGAGDSVGLPGPSAVCADADDLQQSRRNFGLLYSGGNGERPPRTEKSGPFVLRWVQRTH